METLVIGPALRILDWFHGETIRWFRYVGLCPCNDIAKQTFDKKHALCGGTGKLHEEVNVSRHKAIITTVTASKVFTGIGELQTGDLTCATWPKEIPLTYLDHVLIPSRTRYETTLLKRGAGVDAILDAANAAVLTTLTVDRVFDLRGPIVEGWTLQAGGIAWSAGQGPAKGAQYTVHYRYIPRWEVLDSGILARANDPHLQQIPQRVGLRLMPLVR